MFCGQLPIILVYELFPTIRPTKPIYQPGILEVFSELDFSEWPCVPGRVLSFATPSCFHRVTPFLYAELDTPVAQGVTSRKHQPPILEARRCAAIVRPMAEPLAPRLNISSRIIFSTVRSCLWTISPITTTLLSGPYPPHSGDLLLKSSATRVLPLASLRLSSRRRIRILKTSKRWFG